ncbi:hypothetical protein [Streptomyces sp. NPDC095613]|uniref:hypothetical protein n=1 Tax=Streptomyces sp. NPDC095613 TaxID=3155540 RepID=UPI0033204472
MTVTEPSPEVLRKLEEAMRCRAGEHRQETIRSAPEPTPPKQPTMREDAVSVDVRAAGNAVSKTFFVDHYFGYPYGDLWMYDGAAWHGLGTLTAQDEQGPIQVAFASNSVEVKWKDNGDISGIRCWKFLT